MICKYCGREIEDGSSFCNYCGKQQQKVKCCIKCGKEIVLEDKWCGYCGALQCPKDEDNLDKTNHTMQSDSEKQINIAFEEDNDSQNDKEELPTEKKNNDMIKNQIEFQDTKEDIQQNIEQDKEESFQTNRLTPSHKYVLIGIFCAVIFVFWGYRICNAMGSFHANSDSITTIQTPASNPILSSEESNNPEITSKEAIYTAFCEFLEKASKQAEEELENVKSSKYFLKNISGDEIPEIFIVYHGECCSDYHCWASFYNGTVKEIYSENSGIDRIGYYVGSNYVISSYGYQGEYDMQKVTFNNGELKSDCLEEGYTEDDYPKCNEPEPTWYDTTNTQPIRHALGLQ